MKKSTFALVFSLIFLLFSTVGSLVQPKAWAVQQISNIVQDDFEGYTVGTFPAKGGWSLWFSGIGNQYQTITENISYSGGKCMKLLGSSDLAAFAVKVFDSTSPLIGYEVAIRVEETQNRIRDVARVAFTSRISGYITREYASVWFLDNGTIATGNGVFQQYNPGEWYKVRLLMDRELEVYSVWINDQLRAENITVASVGGWGSFSTLYEIEGFSVSQCYYGVPIYFDDVKVFSSYEADPLIELVPSMGISQTTVVGSGFAPMSDVAISWSNIRLPTVPNPLVTDRSGNFTAIISILNQTAPGAYTVMAIDGLNNQATANFTVLEILESKPTPTLTPSPSPAPFLLSSPNQTSTPLYSTPSPATSPTNTTTLTPYTPQTSTTPNLPDSNSPKPSQEAPEISLIVLPPMIAAVVLFALILKRKQVWKAERVAKDK